MPTTSTPSGLAAYGYQPEQQMAEGEPTGQWSTRPGTDYERLYSDVAAGKYHPNSFNELLGADTGVSTGEFAMFSPEVQAWAKTHPQELMQAMLAHRNPANNDLASVGAEGGISGLGDIRIGKDGKTLDYSGTKYLDVHDENDLGGLAALAAIAAAIYTGGTSLGLLGAGEGALGAEIMGPAMLSGEMGTTALADYGLSSMMGLDAATGALPSGLSSAALEAAYAPSTGLLSEVASTLNGIQPGLADRVGQTAIKTAIDAAQGKDIDPASIAANLALSVGMGAANTAGADALKDLGVSAKYAPGLASAGTRLAVSGGKNAESVLGDLAFNTGASALGVPNNISKIIKPVLQGGAPSLTGLASLVGAPKDLTTAAQIAQNPLSWLGKNAPKIIVDEIKKAKG